MDCCKHAYEEVLQGAEALFEAQRIASCDEFTPMLAGLDALNLQLVSWWFVLDRRARNQITASALEQMEQHLQYMKSSLAVLLPQASPHVLDQSVLDPIMGTMKDLDQLESSLDFPNPPETYPGSTTVESSLSGGREDILYSQELVPDIQQAGPIFLSETTRQQKEDPPRKSTPVELPDPPPDPSSYEEVWQRDQSKIILGPDEVQHGIPENTLREPPNVELNPKLSLSTSNSRKRLATSADEDAASKKNSESDLVKNSTGTSKRPTSIPIEKVERRKRLEKLVSRRPLSQGAIGQQKKDHPHDSMPTELSNVPPTYDKAGHNQQTEMKETELNATHTGVETQTSEKGAIIAKMPIRPSSSAVSPKSNSKLTFSGRPWSVENSLKSPQPYQEGNRFGERSWASPAGQVLTSYGNQNWIANETSDTAVANYGNVVDVPGSDEAKTGDSRANYGNLNGAAFEEFMK